MGLVGIWYMEDLISVIIPVYKVELYLERCLKSIISQTYKNIEILLVDDGSPDQCGKICDKYAENDRRIKVYHKNNGGLSDARNFGVEHSQGRYITFIDSDDYVSENYVEYLYDLLVDNNADISCCCFVRATSDHAEFILNREINDVIIMSGVDACKELTGGLYHTLVTAWGKLCHSKIVKMFPFPKGRKHEDEATTCKYFYSANKVVIGNKCCYAYYVNQSSIMHSIDNELNKDAIWAQEHRALFFERQNEKSLATASWDKLFYYCLYDSLDHHGRCDSYLNNLSKKKKLSKRTEFELNLYNSSPWILNRYLHWIVYPIGKLRDKVKYRRCK